MPRVCACQPDMTPIPWFRTRTISFSWPPSLSRKTLGATHDLWTLSYPSTWVGHFWINEMIDDESHSLGVLKTTSYCTMSYCTMSYYILLYYVLLCPIVLCPIVLCRIMSYCTMSYCTMSYYVLLKPADSNSVVLYIHCFNLVSKSNPEISEASLQVEVDPTSCPVHFCPLVVRIHQHTLWICNVDCLSGIGLN